MGRADHRSQSQSDTRLRERMGVKTGSGHYAGYGGGGCRNDYSHEWPRMLILLMTMQGLGKPGTSISSPDRSMPIPPNVTTGLPTATTGLLTAADHNPPNPVRQTLYQTVAPTGITNPPVKWYGAAQMSATDEQFTQKTYPLQGFPEVKMVWMDHGARITDWNCGAKWIEMYRSPKLDFIVAQDPWLENDSLFADLILPVTTPFEQIDAGMLGWRAPGPGHGMFTANCVAVYMKKCIEPLGESKSDYEINDALGQRLGIGQQFDEGRTVEDWIIKEFNQTSLPKFISYDQFKSKGYYVFKFPDTWTRNPGLQWFYNKPNIGGPSEGLVTPSGKIEFYSQNLAKYFPNDKERPPVPHYIAQGSTHQESLSTARAKTYPLMCESPHPRYRFHSRYNSVNWLNELPAYKVYKNGLYYEAVWMSPTDAKARGIVEGDIVRIFNERGGVLAGAHVTERMKTGVIRIPDGAPLRSWDPTKPYQDTGGAINLITPYETSSTNAFGMDVTAFLVQVEKFTG